MIRLVGKVPPGRINEESPMSTTTSESRIHTVVGMTCDHCVRSVTEEAAEVPGVTQVEVDLTSGRLVVTGEDVSDEAVAAAVEEAGYEVQP
jgi:copper chaperone